MPHQLPKLPPTPQSIEEEEPLELPPVLAAQRQVWTRVLVSVLRSRRHDSDLSARALGALIAWSETMVNKAEAGKKDIPFADALMWALRTNMTPEELFDAFLSGLRQHEREAAREQTQEQARRRRSS